MRSFFLVSGADEDVDGPSDIPVLSMAWAAGPRRAMRRRWCLNGVQ